MKTGKKKMAFRSTLFFGVALGCSAVAFAQELPKVASNFDTTAWARPTENPPQMNVGKVFGELPVPCTFSHLRHDDPIRFPGQVGKSPLHVFFGNNRTDANSTYS